MRRALALSLSLWLAACGGTGPRAVAVGEDVCDYCRMTVSDPRFAAEVVTSTGRVHVFDSVDCLAGYVRGAGSGALSSIWVTDVSQPGTFVRAEEAGYLVDGALHGPMGRSVAFASADAARSAQQRFGGTVADWAAVLADTSAHSSH